MEKINNMKILVKSCFFVFKKHPRIIMTTRCMERDSENVIIANITLAQNVRS